MDDQLGRLPTPRYISLIVYWKFFTNHIRNARHINVRNKMNCMPPGNGYSVNSMLKGRLRNLCCGIITKLIFNLPQQQPQTNWEIRLHAKCKFYK